MDNMSLEITHEPEDICKVKFPFKDNRACIVAQVATSHVWELMNMNQDEINKKIIEMTKRK